LHASNLISRDEADTQNWTLPKIAKDKGVIFYKYHTLLIPFF